MEQKGEGGGERRHNIMSCWLLLLYAGFCIKSTSPTDHFKIQTSIPCTITHFKNRSSIITGRAILCKLMDTVTDCGLLPTLHMLKGMCFEYVCVCVFGKLMLMEVCL